VRSAARVIAMPAFLIIAAGAAIAAPMPNHGNIAAKDQPAMVSTGPADATPAIISPTTAPAPASSTSPAWLPLISAISGLIGAFIGGYFATRNAKAAIVQKTNELEIASIDERLGNFVAPFEQLSAENLKLSRELKRRHGGEAFRTLPALLDPEWKQTLSSGDRALVDALVENGTTLRRMILDHGGAVSPAIRDHMAAASMHFRMLSLAYQGSLDPDPAWYAAYVYPRQLDGVLSLERDRLEARRELLRIKPDVPHSAIGDLTIPDGLKLPPPPAAA